MLFVEFNEKRDLRPQYFRFERFRHVVDRTERIALENVVLINARRGNEYYRRVLRMFALTNQLGEFEPIDARHLYVEKDKRYLVG